MDDREIIIHDTIVKPGEEATIALPAPELYTQTPMCMPVHVINGRKPGPRLFVCAAIHGDEITGVEIIRRLLRLSALKHLRGALIAVPIVNVYGLISQSRYMPDRRDLNRTFPGSKRGSLTARLAHLFMQEIVLKCTHGIDLHSGTGHRSNLPQMRVNLDHPENERLAKAFRLPVILEADLRDGSLRQAVHERGMPFLVYEAGEALRLDDVSIRVGVKGIVSVMRALDMLPPRPANKPQKSVNPMIAHSSLWVRAPESGIFHPTKNLGQPVNEKECLGVIADPFGGQETEVLSPITGLIIGKNNLPLVHEGEALFHIASFKKIDIVASQVDQL